MLVEVEVVLLGLVVGCPVPWRGVDPWGAENEPRRGYDYVEWRCLASRATDNIKLYCVTATSTGPANVVTKCSIVHCITVLGIASIWVKFSKT